MSIFDETRRERGERIGGRIGIRLKYFDSDLHQLEMFDLDELRPRITFEKYCFKFCGDLCDCGKKDFLDSYASPYHTP